MTILIIVEQNIASHGRIFRIASALKEANQRVIGGGFTRGHRSTPATSIDVLDAVYEHKVPQESKWRAPLTALVHAPTAIFPRWANIAYWLIPHRTSFLKKTLRWLEHNNETPTVVLAMHWTAGPLAQKIAKRYDAELIYDANELATAEHDYDWRWCLTMKPAIHLLEKQLIQAAEKTLTVCDGFADEICKNYNLTKQPIVIRNLPANQAEPPKPLGLCQTFIFVGLARPDRRLDILIDSVVNWAPKKILVLALVGLPTHIQKLKERVSHLKIDHQIVFLDPIPPNELVIVLSQYDVGLSILPTGSSQTQLLIPNKIYQYLQAGLPVISSPLLSSAELINRFQAGHILDESTPSAISEVVNQWEHSTHTVVGKGVAKFQKETNWIEERSLIIEACSPKNSNNSTND